MNTNQKILFTILALHFLLSPIEFAAVARFTYRVMYYSEEKDCTRNSIRVYYEGMIDERCETTDSCSRQYINGGLYYLAQECNAPFSSFEKVMAMQAASNFTVEWFYAQKECYGQPVAIEAIAVGSCEGIEETLCQQNRIKTCIQPQSYIGLQPEIIPINNPINNPSPPNKTSCPEVTREVITILPDNNPSLSFLEQVLIATTVCGWSYAILSTIVYIKQRRSNDAKHPVYIPMTEFGDSSPEQPIVITFNHGNDVSALLEGALNTETKSQMLRIPPSEVIINQTKLLGSGQASEVYAGIWRQKPIAIKIPRDRDAITKVLTELTVFRDIDQHPNIVEVYGYFHFKSKLCVVLELCANQKTRVKSEDLSVADQLSIAMGIAAGVAHLHNSKRQVVHRDLKPSNILLTKPGLLMTPKIADFDYSRFLASSAAQSYSVPTIAYAAPESIGRKDYQKQYSIKSDSWAYGATIFYMMTKQTPFGAIKGNLTQKRIEKKAKINFALLQALPTDPFTQLLVSIALDCLKDDPEERPDFDHICARFKSFFNDFLQRNKNNASVM